MRVLEFEVDRQTIRKKPGSDFSNIVAGTVGYLRASFTFSGEWDNCKKAVIFYAMDDAEYPVALDENGSCLIPAEVLGGEHFELSVMGARGQSYILKSTKYRVKQEVV